MGAEGQTILNLEDGVLADPAVGLLLNVETSPPRSVMNATISFMDGGEECLFLAMPGGLGVDETGSPETRT